MAAVHDSRDSEQPLQLGKYRLEKPIGEGGMGMVYSAFDQTLQRRVAIKLLRHNLAADAEALNRFLREARAAAQLNHPHVVSIYEVARRETTYFIVMELVPGGNAAERLAASGGLTWREATVMTTEACRGLVAAHAAGLVHRDIKPANFMLTADGRVKLADFGLSKPLDRRGLTLTAANQTCGTPAYMSPEQCRCDEVNELCDIYSMGASYFALLAGRPPFVGDQPVQVMFAHCSTPCPDPRQFHRDIPESCVEVVQKAMAKNPVDRFGSAKEMLDALEQITSGRDVVAPPTLPISPASTIIVRRKALVADRRSRWRGFRWRGLVLCSVVAVATVAVGAALVAFLANSENAKTTEASKETKTMSLGASVSDTKSFRQRIGSSGVSIDLGAPVAMVAFSPRDDLVAGTCGEVPRFKCVDLNTGDVTWDVSLETFQRNDVLPSLRRGDSHFVATFSADGKQLAIGVDGMQHGTWLLHPGRERPWDVDSYLSPGPASSLSFSPNGRMLAVTFQNVPPGADRIRFWETLGLTHANPLRAHPTVIRAARFLPNGTLILADDRGNLVRFNIQSRRTESIPTGLAIDVLTVSPDGKRAAVAGDGRLQIWNLVAGTKRLDTRSVQVHDAVFSPDASRVLTAGGPNGDNVVALWRTDALELLDEFHGHLQRVNRLSLSVDGTILVSGSEDGTLRLWRVPANEGTP